MSEFTPERIAKDNELIENTSLMPWIFQENNYDGKNWLLFTMSFGLGHDGKEHNLYVTTDHARGDDLGTADSDAEYVLLACNKYPDALDEITALSARVAELEETIECYDTVLNDEHLVLEQEDDELVLECNECTFPHNEGHSEECSQYVDTESLSASNAKLREKIADLEAAGDELTHPKHAYRYYCMWCGNLLVNIDHAPDCPVTLWQKVRQG